MGHGPALSNFMKWCDDSYLQLSIAKTKEILIDLHRNPPVMAPTFINGLAVETVSQYSYLGNILNDKMTSDANSDAICKKANQKFFHLLLSQF